MSEIYVVGVAMTPFGKSPESTVKKLTRDAVAGALSDAGCDIADIGAAWFANSGQGASEGQYSVRGQMALRPMGFEGIPITNVENACASGSNAFNQAYTDLRAGLSEVALAVGCEKMTFPDKEKSFKAFLGGMDVHNTQETLVNLLSLGEGVSPPEGSADQGGMQSIFMDIYAAMARFHMKRFGTTQRQLAAVSSKNHFHSTMNRLSQYQKDMSIEEVLNARLISWPLTLPMCSPISDGAAAAILCRKEALQRFDTSRAIRVYATQLGTSVNRKPEEVEKHICHLLALKAYDQAGLEPKDVSIAEVHDATAFAEVQQSENLGFCEFGQGGWIAERGETRLGGRVPINVSGGLESKGHPIGATGLGQIFELVVQLRGEAGDRQVENARVGIAENGGGFYGIEEAAACVTILGR
jgi:acetyl-CoA acyltransferase